MVKKKSQLTTQCQLISVHLVFVEDGGVCMSLCMWALRKTKFRKARKQLERGSAERGRMGEERNRRGGFGMACVLLSSGIQVFIPQPHWRPVQRSSVPPPHCAQLKSQRCNIRLHRLALSVMLLWWIIFEDRVRVNTAPYRNSSPALVHLHHHISNLKLSIFKIFLKVHHEKILFIINHIWLSNACILKSQILDRCSRRFFFLLVYIKRSNPVSLRSFTFSGEQERDLPLA